MLWLKSGALNNIWPPTHAPTPAQPLARVHVRTCTCSHVSMHARVYVRMRAQTRHDCFLLAHLRRSARRWVSLHTGTELCLIECSVPSASEVAQTKSCAFLGRARYYHPGTETACEECKRCRRQELSRILKPALHCSVPGRPRRRRHCSGPCAF